MMSLTFAEDNVTKRGAFGTHSSKTVPTSTRYSHGNEANSHCLRSKAISPHTSWQCSEEEQVTL